MGSIKNLLFKGGGIIFGLRLRSYLFKLNKGLKRLVRKLVFLIKVKELNIIVFEDFGFEVLNIKNFINVLKVLGLENKKFLFVLGELNKNVYLLLCNLKVFNVVISLELSIYVILNINNLVFLEGFLELIEENLSK